MSNLISEKQRHIQLITFNSIAKHNAFDDIFLKELQALINSADQDPEVRVIVLKANGKHFSAGADLAWMQRMVNYSEQENIDDAMILANTMHTIYDCQTPVIAMVHGAAFGGGAGIVAACDIAIAADDASFCFSEVKLGLIPAVISPYVIQAIGPRATSALFMSAEKFSSERAYELGLIHKCVPADELLSYTLQYSQNLANNAPLAVKESKSLVRMVCGETINHNLHQKTAQAIAQKRISPEAQKGLQAFLDKGRVRW